MYDIMKTKRVWLGIDNNDKPFLQIYDNKGAVTDTFPKSAEK